MPRPLLDFLLTDVPPSVNGDLSVNAILYFSNDNQKLKMHDGAYGEVIGNGVFNT